MFRFVFLVILMAKVTTEIPNTDIVRKMNAMDANRPSSSGGGSPLYALYILDVEEGRILREFGFDISPQSMRLAENAASDVTATQEGGYWVDERGQ